MYKEEAVESVTANTVEAPSSPGVPEEVIPEVYWVPPPLIPSIVSLNLRGLPAFEASD